jgi:transposase-like protein
MVGMEEFYPRTILELEDRFATEDACREYLVRLRWPDGFICPRCRRQGGWLATRGRVICRDCRHQASVTAGTIFQDTHKPLRLWFRAIWQVTSQKNGASAFNVQQVLGLGSYLTAWTWLHKLRRAMVRPGRDFLGGRVEVDETYVGGEGEGKKKGGRGSDKALVAIAVEEDGSGMGRIRMARIADESRSSLYCFIRASIKPGSTIHTDGNPSYKGLEKIGYAHEATVLLGREKDAATQLLPRVHRVASLLKRWLLGTHQGAVHPNYLDYYLDEFTFRFNRRTSRSRGKLFYRLLQQAVQVEPAPYRSIVADAAEARDHKL